MGVTLSEGTVTADLVTVIDAAWGGGVYPRLCLCAQSVSRTPRWISRRRRVMALVIKFFQQPVIVNPNILTAIAIESILPLFSFLSWSLFAMSGSNNIPTLPDQEPVYPSPTAPTTRRQWPLNQHVLPNTTSEKKRQTRGLIFVWVQDKMDTVYQGRIGILEAFYLLGYY